VAVNGPLAAPTPNGNPASHTGGIAIADNIQIDLQADFPARSSLHVMAADTHADQCIANYNQCMKGCDGAASCSKQCKVNYDKCMDQNK
jgi:hypothetical protein